MGHGGHGSGHGHGHGHVPDGEGDRRRIALALGVTVTVLASGAVGAVVTGSLALLADLGHQVTDAAALFAAWVASRLAQRPPSTRRTFGLGRAEVLGAALNALALLAVTVWVAVEGIERLAAPTDVPGLGLLVFGAVGLLGNLVSLVVLFRGDQANMNLRGAALHVLGDALGSVAVLVAAAVTLTTGWVYADTVASLAIVVILLPRTVDLLREAGHLLLEGAPAGIDVDEVRAALLAVPCVDEVHDLHVWAINDRNPAMSAHLVVSSPRAACGDGSDGAVLDPAAAVLRERFGLHHSTLQLEAADHADHESSCSPPGADADVLESTRLARRAR